MNKQMITFLSIAIVATAMFSCQPRQKKDPAASIASEDTAASQDPDPVESGYAAVNGLEMYYEVYGEGKPIVLLHGSFMNIPMNWSHFIPLLAKDRKVIIPMITDFLDSDLNAPPPTF